MREMLSGFVGYLPLVMALLLPALCAGGSRTRPGTDIETTTTAAFCEASFASCIGSGAGPSAEYFYPQSSKSDLWSQTELRMEKFVKNPVPEPESGRIKTLVTIVRHGLQSYLKSGNVERGHTLRGLLNACVEVFYLMLNSSSVHHFVLQIIAAGSLHLSLLREQLLAGAAIFPGQNATEHWADDIVQSEKKYETLFNKSYHAWAAVRTDVTVTDFSYSRHEVVVKDEYLDQVILVERYHRKSTWAWIFDRLGYDYTEGKQPVSEAKEKAHARANSYLADQSQEMAQAINDVARSSVYWVCQLSTDKKYIKCVLHAPWFINPDEMYVESTIFDMRLVISRRNRTVGFLNGQ